MTANPYISSREQALSGALTLMMHGLFFALLVFGVTWQKREPTALVAELWSNLPPLPAPKVETPPPPKVEPEPPKPAPKVEVKPPPRVEPKPQPKADIALQDKKEKERKAKEQELADKKKREEQAKLDAAKQRQAQEAEAKRLAQEQADAQKKLAQAAAAAQAREIDKYKQAIATRIRRFIVEPPSLQGNPEVELDIIVLPGGEVLDVRTKRPSGQTPWDNAVERAIRRAQPLPVPSDPALMKEFRELNLKFRPKD